MLLLSTLVVVDVAHFFLQSQILEALARPNEPWQGIGCHHSMRHALGMP